MAMKPIFGQPLRIPDSLRYPHGRRLKHLLDVGAISEPAYNWLYDAVKAGRADIGASDTELGYPANQCPPLCDQPVILLLMPVAGYHRPDLDILTPAQFMAAHGDELAAQAAAAAAEKQQEGGA